MRIPVNGLPIPADSGNLLIPREFLGEHQRTKESRVVPVLEDLRFYPIKETFHFSFARKAHEKSPFKQPSTSTGSSVPWPYQTEDGSAGPDYESGSSGRREFENP